MGTNGNVRSVGELRALYLDPPDGDDRRRRSRGRLAGGGSASLLCLVPGVG